jgi:type IV pilus assembly protein PilM
MTFGVGTRPWAGLDLGSHSVKLVALAPGSTRGRHAEVVLPAALRGDEPPAPGALAGVIAECMRQLGATPRMFRGITIGVSGPDVIVKQLALPLMEDSEVAGALRFEARKHLPFDLQTMVLDHQVLARHSGDKRLDVLLATVSQQHLDQVLAPLHELGVEAAIVDATPLALSNGFTQTLPREVTQEADAHVLVDLGHRSAWLTLRIKGQPFFARRIDWGGASLVHAIASVLPGGHDEATAWLRAPGTSLRQDLAAAHAGRDAVTRLAEEVRRSLAFYGTTAPLPEAVMVHVSGGTARLDGLVEHLGAALGRRTRLFGPSEAGGKDAPMAPQFAQALGLALRFE